MRTVAIGRMIGKHTVFPVYMVVLMGLFTWTWLSFRRGGLLGCSLNILHLRLSWGDHFFFHGHKYLIRNLKNTTNNERPLLKLF